MKRKETYGTLEEVKAGLEKLRARRKNEGLANPPNPEDFKFRKGDVVQIKSGGPRMVIEACLHYDERVHPCVGYFCCYIHEGRVEKNEFAEEALEKALPKDAP